MILKRLSHSNRQFHATHLYHIKSKPKDTEFHLPHFHRRPIVFMFLTKKKKIHLLGAALTLLSGKVRPLCKTHRPAPIISFNAFSLPHPKQTFKGL